MAPFAFIIIIIAPILFQVSAAFVVAPRRAASPRSLFAVPRYGPPLPDDDHKDTTVPTTTWTIEDIEEGFDELHQPEFGDLIQQIITSPTAASVPGLLTRNIELLVNVVTFCNAHSEDETQIAVILGPMSKSDDKNRADEAALHLLRRLVASAVSNVSRDLDEHVAQVCGEEFSALTENVEKLLQENEPKRMSVENVTSDNDNSRGRMLAESNNDFMESVVGDLQKDLALQDYVAGKVTELIVDFVDMFVQQAQILESNHKRLLGDVLRTVSNPNRTPLQRQEDLDALLTGDKAELLQTPGFHRHLENECQRIMAQPSVSPESARLLELLQMIQARILEQAGQELGAAAQVLGQLCSYESSQERIAVLEAGLTVRGVGFAKEMLELTTQALNDFEAYSNNEQEMITMQQQGGGVDPGLVAIVREIHERLQEYTRKYDDDEDFQ